MARHRCILNESGVCRSCGGRPAGLKTVIQRKFIVLQYGVAKFETSSWPNACAKLLEQTENGDDASLVTFHKVEGKWWLRSRLDVHATQAFARDLEAREQDALMELVR